MKTLILAGVLLLCLSATCASGDVTPEGDDQPPSKINVERPGFPYDLGDYGVVMDNRFPMVLKCTAEGTPDPTYRWEYNGGPLPDDERIVVEDGTLTISAPTINDEGNYQCFATNSYGTALSSKYSTTYAFQLEFDVVGQVEHTFTEGEPAVMECGAPDGAPKPRIYWTHAQTSAQIVTDDRVSLSPKGDLHFANTVQEDGNMYYCFAANDLLGNFMRSPLHRVTITSGTGDDIAATITSLEASVTGLRTSEFVIKCLASGNPTPQISWFRNNEELPGANSRVTLESYNQELKFSSLGFEDAGQYECRANNGVGPPATKTVHLTVESAPYFTENPEDLVLAPGESSEIRCLAGGVPSSSKQWMQNGGPIRDSENSIFEVVGDTITINSPREGDSTVFQCMLENKHGQRYGSYTITILAIPATISKPPTPRPVVSENDDFGLECLSFGSPTPRIEWHKDGVKLEDGGRIMIDTKNEGAFGYLNISGVQLDDAGTYVCHALNSVGNTSADSVVTVRLPTSVTLEPPTQTVPKGDHADFTCDFEVDDRADPSIKWYFNDVEIHPGGKGSDYALRGDATLRIKSAKSSQTGTFKCEVSTDYDQDFAESELIVQAEPDAPYNVEVTIVGLEATLEWTEPESNNAEITGYTIEWRTQHDSFPEPSDIAPWQVLRQVSASSTTELITLRNYLTYSFRVIAENDIGLSERSTEAQGEMTAPAPPDDDSEPTNIGSAATAPGVLTISWDEVHPFYHNGPDFAYVIQWREEGETEWQNKTITDWQTSSFDISADKYENIEFKVSVKNDVGPGPEPVEKSGTTGEGTPAAAPSNVQLEVLSSNAINVTWDAVSPDEVNGEIVSYNIYYTIQNAQGSEMVQKCPPDGTSCVLDNLEAFTSYEIAVAVENRFAEGPRSLPQTIKTDEGVPSEAKIVSLESTSYRLAVTWERPAMENGNHLGYHLTITKYDDDDAIIDEVPETINDPGQLKFKKDDVDPDTKYEVTITAFTKVGDGPPEKRDTMTGAAGVPQKPGKPKDNLIGKDFLNITWNLDDDEPKPDQVRACYKIKDAEGDCEYTDYVDVLDTDFIMIEDLEEGSKYEVILEFKNREGTEKGNLEVFTTTGKESSTGTATLAPWFIALICIIILLLLIILIICILKSQKGGKYNVSDKEKQLKDENAPLKPSDGFDEFSPNSEFPDDMDGSQDSLASHPEGSEGDSLKEYADDEDPSKFNEEGSFIEEYHDPKTRSTDQREGGTSTFV